MTTSRTKCNLYFVKGVYILGKGVPLVTEGNGLYEVPHEEVTGTLNDNGFKQTEYRYAGQNPDNYIMFNNELWRIIGLVNAMTSENKVEQRVKIVRNESIGTFSWDTSDSNVNEGKGVNEWSQSSLMKLLNSGYETESVGGSLYWNRKGNDTTTCYTGPYKETDKCNFSSTGLFETSKLLLEENIYWNTGSIDTDESNYAVEKVYETERGNLVGNSKCHGGGWCNDNVQRNTTWKSKDKNKAVIGLMYLTDHAYANGGTNRIDCNKNISENNSNCYEGNLTRSYGGNNDWTLVTAASMYTSRNGFGWTFSNGSYVFMISDRREVKPTAYLKTNVKILSDSNNGSSQNPYNLIQIAKYE